MMEYGPFIRKFFGWISFNEGRGVIRKDKNMCVDMCACACVFVYTLSVKKIVGLKNSRPNF